MSDWADAVPEVYYDLIARVPPGVVFLGVLASEFHPLKPQDLTAGVLAAFLVLGYTAGIILSGVGTWIAAILWRLQWKRAVRRKPKLAERLKIFDDDVARLFEHLCRDERNRHVLNKLTAEVVLCASLFVAFFLLLIVLPWTIGLLAGTIFSAVAVWTRQHNATKRQTTLTLNEAMEPWSVL